ncbi:Zn(2)-C6 fungal-type DNA-binding domain [Phaffia rhodozyma]|uniref:Zn(2)-C6 fungal-type DNA-binding domain n=1 Tax=Phaffia rhodozyma TaxID=264483 RepID=A0A0F7STV5_PHARH|nr:Zn(2)-C6 fungal-type DNA-binding domain [Phaffia rhodozyma]
MYGQQQQPPHPGQQPHLYQQQHRQHPDPQQQPSYHPIPYPPHNQSQHVSHQQQPQQPPQPPQPPHHPHLHSQSLSHPHPHPQSHPSRPAFPQDSRTSHPIFSASTLPPLNALMGAPLSMSSSSASASVPAPARTAARSSLQDDQYAKKRARREIEEEESEDDKDRKTTTSGKDKGKKRAVQSCSECRRRKIKCDRKFPCQPCIARGDAAVCREVEKHAPQSAACASQLDLLALTHRVIALEALVQRLERDRPRRKRAQVGQEKLAWTENDVPTKPRSRRDSNHKPENSEEAADEDEFAIEEDDLDEEERSTQQHRQDQASSHQQDDDSEDEEDFKRLPSEVRQKKKRRATMDLGEGDGQGTSREGTAGIDSETEGAALTLEHLAFGRRRDDPTQVAAPVSSDQVTNLHFTGSNSSSSALKSPRSTAAEGRSSVSAQVSVLDSTEPSSTTQPTQPSLSSVSAPIRTPSAATSTINQVLTSSPSNFTQDSAPITTHSGSAATGHASSTPNSGKVDSPSMAIKLVNKPSKASMGQKPPMISKGGPLGAMVIPQNNKLGVMPGPTFKDRLAPSSRQRRRQSDLSGQREDEGDQDDPEQDNEEDGENDEADEERAKQEDMRKRQEIANVLLGKKGGNPTLIFETFFQRSELHMEAFMSCLPGREKEEALIEHYFAKVEWFHHCLHVPTVLRQCHEFWDIPHDKRAALCAPSWIGLFLMLLLLSLTFMDSDKAESLGFSKEDQEILPSMWFAGARGSLWQSDFLANHSLENLQVIVLCGVYLINQDRADAHWGILGSGVKIAQMMGLNRLGAEQGELKPGDQPLKWTGRWESIITRETARRIWWQMVFLDASISPSYGYATSIHPEQMSTALPANICDEDLVDGQPLRPRPMSVHTPMSYHLARLRTIQTAYQTIYLMNTSVHPPYEDIMAIDGELAKIPLKFPSFYQVNTGPDMKISPDSVSNPEAAHWEKIVLHLSLQTRRMRLHRPYLSRGYTNKKYAYSTEQCVKAAQISLELINSGTASGRTSSFLNRWWIPVLQTFFASCVCLIDMLNTPRDAKWEETLQSVSAALRFLKISETHSSPARGSIRVIEALLLEALSSHPQELGADPSRRGSIESVSSSDDTHALQRAVRRLVKNNAVPSSTRITGAQSPSSASSTIALTPSSSTGAMPAVRTATSPPTAPFSSTDHQASPLQPLMTFSTINSQQDERRPTTTDLRSTTSLAAYHPLSQPILPSPLSNQRLGPMNMDLLTGQNVQQQSQQYQQQPPYQVPSSYTQPNLQNQLPSSHPLHHYQQQQLLQQQQQFAMRPPPVGSNFATSQPFQHFFDSVTEGPFMSDQDGFNGFLGNGCSGQPIASASSATFQPPLPIQNDVYTDGDLMTQIMGLSDLDWMLDGAGSAF